MVEPELGALSAAHCIVNEGGFTEGGEMEGGDMEGGVVEGSVVGRCGGQRGLTRSYDI